LKKNFEKNIKKTIQLVWKKSTQLGIGIAHNGDKTYVVGRYSPGKFSRSETSV